MALLDVATLAMSLAGAYWIIDCVVEHKLLSFAGYPWLLLSVLVIWLGCLWVFGLYRSVIYAVGLTLLRRLVQVHLFAALLLFSLTYLTRSDDVRRLLLQNFLAISLVLLLCQKFMLAVYLDNARRRRHSHRRKIVLLSHPEFAGRHLDLIRTQLSILADVVRVLSPTAVHQPRIDPGVFGAQLGNVEELPDLLQAQVVDEVIAVSAIEAPVLERVARWCSARGILLRIWLELPRPQIGYWAVEHFGDGAFFLSLATIPQRPVYVAVKRVIDLLGAAAGMLLCGAIYLWYGFRLKRESGGSVLFRQQRVGQNGRTFTLYKFRTMCLEAEQQKAALIAQNEMSGPIFKLKNDPRVTRLGRKLRKHHLDELPQCWNVLKGDMSLVGTRPPTKNETALYGNSHYRRLSMKPGITGLWQLNGNGGVNDFEHVVKLDCDYIDNCSLWLDLRILTRTVAKVLRGGGW